MAGGIGSRFWPLSRTCRPKQFLDILGTGKTLLQQTFARFLKVCDAGNIYVVTSAEYKDHVIDQLPEINPDNVLLEPMMRNTAPCVAYANYRISEINPDANIVVAPSDHLIIKESEFVKVIEQGLAFTADNKGLLTLGIKPDRPDTGYGYIQVNSEIKVKHNNTKLKKVKTFTEKPDYDLAKVFYESGEFYWNSGIFLWSLNSIKEAFEKHLPEVNSLFGEGLDLYNTNKEEAFIKKTYSKCRNISLDYGIMEKASNVFVLCSDFGWSDLGTWGSLYANSDKDENGNAIRGENVMAYDLKDCVINVPDKKLVVLQGLEEFIVVESDNILLICRKKEEQQIRQFVNDVKMEKGEKFI